MDKLQRRGWHLPNRCYLCGCDEETVHHLLLHCSVVSPLWEIIFSLVGISWVFQDSQGSLTQLERLLCGERRLKIWKSVPLCIFWKERSRIAFRNGSFAVQRLKHSFVSNLWGWNSLYIGKKSLHLQVFWSG